MFNSHKPAQDKKKKPASRDTAVTILTSGCHFNGKLYCRGASRIGGKIEGQVISEGLLIIEGEATIIAEIKADEAIIQGKVTGKLHAASRVELCSTSQFDGDIITPILIVREGAQFNGRSSMVAIHDAPAKSDKKSAKTLAANGGHSPGFDRDSGKPELAVLKVPEVNVTSN